MTPSELLRRPPLGEHISISRDRADIITGRLVGLSVRPEKIDATAVDGHPAYLPGPTTITLTLAPWWADVDLSPLDEIRVIEVDG